MEFGQPDCGSEMIRELQSREWATRERDLRLIMADCAERALQYARPAYVQVLRAALDVVRRYAVGEATDAELSAAHEEALAIWSRRGSPSARAVEIAATKSATATNADCLRDAKALATTVVFAGVACAIDQSLAANEDGDAAGMLRYAAEELAVAQIARKHTTSVN